MSNLAVIDRTTQILESRSEQIKNVLPRHIDYHRFEAIALGFIRSNSAIQKCDAVSIALCIYGCAQLGLMPDPQTGHAYLVPFKGKATLVVGYKGFVELARRRKDGVDGVVSQVVYEGDECELDLGTAHHIVHKPYYTVGAEDRGDPVFVYCVARMKSGEEYIEAMPWGEVLNIKQKVEKRGPSAVWRDHLYEMARKTVVRRAAKLWPQTPELAQATDLDERAERGDAQEFSVQMDDEKHPPAAGDGSDPTLDSLIGAESTAD